MYVPVMVRMLLLKSAEYNLVVCGKAFYFNYVRTQIIRVLWQEFKYMCQSSLLNKWLLKSVFILFFVS